MEDFWTTIGRFFDDFWKLVDDFLQDPRNMEPGCGPNLRNKSNRAEFNFILRTGMRNKSNRDDDDDEEDGVFCLFAPHYAMSPLNHNTRVNTPTCQEQQTT